MRKNPEFRNRCQPQNPSPTGTGASGSQRRNPASARGDFLGRAFGKAGAGPAGGWHGAPVPAQRPRDSASRPLSLAGILSCVGSVLRRALHPRQRGGPRHLELAVISTLSPQFKKRRPWNRMNPPRSVSYPRPVTLRGRESH